MKMTWLKKILLLILALIATLAYLEAGVRILANAAFPLLRTDAAVGSIQVKNFAGRVWDAESQRDNYIVTNSLGYFGKDYPVMKPAGSQRIAVLGDSVVAGVQVATADNFTAQLETALNVSASSGKRFEVMNYGVGGTGTFQQYQTYKKNVAPFQPDVVLLVFHDDFDDNNNKANFDPDNYAAERKAVGLKAFLLNFQLPKFIFSKLQANALVISALKGLGLFESAGLLSAPSDQTVAGKANETPQYYDFTYDLIGRLDKKVRAGGGRLIVLAYPRANDYVLADGWKNNQHSSRLLDFLAQNKIESINPAGDFYRAEIASGDCLTFGCGDHLNEQGHLALASLLFKYFQNNSASDGGF